MNHRHEHRCVVCGSAITLHQGLRGNICADPQCQHTLVRRQQRARARMHERTQSAVARWRRQFPSAGDAAAEEPMVLLPANTKRLVPLPERRRRRFREYFTRSLSLAAARNAGLGGRTGAPEEPDRRSCSAEVPATLAMLGSACAVCRGYCCAQGGDHAFQRPEVVRAYLLQHPELRPRDVLNAYLDHLPRLSYQDSCVFHTRHGCNLPAHMRSQTCHDYLCHGLQDLARAQQGEAAVQVFAAAVEAETPVRAALIRRPLETASEH